MSRFVSMSQQLKVSHEYCTGPTFFHSVDSSSELDIEMLDINFDADSKSSSSLSQRLLFTLPPSAREADMA